jgi:hypothetical protein
LSGPLEAKKSPLKVTGRTSDGQVSLRILWAARAAGAGEAAAPHQRGPGAAGGMKIAAPALRRRGLIRDGYPHSTFRENLLAF